MRINERIIDHNKREKNSHFRKHACESQHTDVWKDDFKILNGNYNSSIKKNISEGLYIRTLKPMLNVREKSIRLELYSWFSCCDFTIKQLYKFDFDWFSLSLKYTIL